MRDTRGAKDPSDTQTYPWIYRAPESSSGSKTEQPISQAGGMQSEPIGSRSKRDGKQT